MPYRRAIKRLAWNLVRWAVTLGAVAYVLVQITWKDQLTLEGGQVVHGWLRTDAQGQRVVEVGDGTSYPVPPDPKDPGIPSPLAPGFITLLKGVHLGYFVTAILAYPLSILLIARRWQWLLQTHDLDPGYREALRLTWIGLLTNNVFPGATGGDVVKGVCIYRRSPGKRIAAIMTVFVDRAIGLFSLMILGGAAILTQRSRPELGGTTEIVMFILLAGLVGGTIFFSRRIRSLLRVSDVVDRLPMREHLRKLDSAIFHFRWHRFVIYKCIFASLAVQIWTIICVWMLGLALRLRIEAVYYFVFFPVIVTVAAFAPSIGGIGVLEWQFQQFFSSVGATPSGAVALCILFRIMSILASLPGAIPTYREFSTHGLPRQVDPDTPDTPVLTVGDASVAS